MSKVLNVAGTESPYQLGAPIALRDLLALPPDGLRYTRDDDGRLAIMSPDHHDRHRGPLADLTALLIRSLDEPFWVVQEPAVAFPTIYTLKGDVLEESFLGPRAVQPDLAVFESRPVPGTGPRDGAFCSSEHLRLVIEILSPSTFRSDLGLGEADEVDKKRSYLASGVPEYWVLNPSVDNPSCPVPLRSGVFFVRSQAGDGWQAVPIDAGRFHSRAIPELVFDLNGFWRRCNL